MSALPARTLLFALALSALLAACASQPRYPVASGVASGATVAAAPTRSPPPPPYAAAPAPEERVAAPRPERSVESRPLPPPGADASSDNAVALRGRASPGPYPPTRVLPPPALETPREVTVQPGETLFDVAERVRTPLRAIIDLNGLQPPYELAPGTRLQIPPPLVYAVGPGDTLFGIARRFSIDPRSLANLNDIALETAIKPGQRIALPSLARDQGANPQASGPSPAGSRVQPTASASASASTSTSARPPAKTAAMAAAAVAAAAARNPSSVAAPAVEAVEAPAQSENQVAALGRGKFQWPAKGDMLSRYGVKGPGQRNDGVNIALPAGSPVKAAAGGEVVYAGDQIPGFGNLVLIKHPGGWVTAYAHLSKIGVKIRQAVSQGQPLGEVGQSGSVDRPQLHFEIRYASSAQEKARPVDPALLLPGG